MADISKKIADEKAKLEKARAALSDDDRAELEQRKELSQLESERLEAERVARNLDLDRRVESAQDALGESASVEGVAVQNYPDTFVVMRNSVAYNAWSQSMASAAASTNKGPIDRAAINRKFAVATVFDWNGRTDFAANPDLTVKLGRFLIDNPGVLIPITDAAARLAGVFAEERKSGT